MGIRLQGPIPPVQVAALIASLQKAFLRKKLSKPIKTKYLLRANSESRELYELYPEGCEALVAQESVARLHHTMSAISPGYSCTISSFSYTPGGFFSSSSRNGLVSVVENLTAKQDAAVGMIIPATVIEYLIESEPLNLGEGTFNAWIEHRNKQIAEAQRRIQQSVSGVAYNLMTDLR